MTNLNNTSVGCLTDGKSGDMTQCVVDATFSAGPSPTLIGLLLAGTLLTSLYIAGDGTVVVPAVVTILVGSLMVPLLPSQYVSLAYAVVVMGGTVGIYAAWVRFTHQGGF